MIRINLLPEEYRRPEATPFPRMITIFAGVAVVFSLLVVNAIVFLRKVPEAKATLQETQNTLASRKKAVEASGYEELVRTIADLGLRKSAINDIYRSRIAWAVKLDQLVDLTPDTIGLMKMDLSEPDRVRGSKNRTDMHGGILTMDCLTRGTDLALYSNFVSALQGGTAAPTPAAMKNASAGPGDLLKDILKGNAFKKPVATADQTASVPIKPFITDFMNLQDLGWIVYEKKGFEPGLRFTLELVVNTRECDKPKVVEKKSSRAQKPE